MYKKIFFLGILIPQNAAPLLGGTGCSCGGTTQVTLYTAPVDETPSESQRRRSSEPESPRTQGEKAAIDAYVSNILEHESAKELRLHRMEANFLNKRIVWTAASSAYAKAKVIAALHAYADPRYKVLPAAEKIKITQMTHDGSIKALRMESAAHTVNFGQAKLSEAAKSLIPILAELEILQQKEVSEEERKAVASRTEDGSHTHRRLTRTKGLRRRASSFEFPPTPKKAGE